MKGSTQVVKGEIEEGVVALTDNDRLHAGGQTTQVVGHVGQAAAKMEVDVDRLVELLLRNAAAEMTMFYCYTILGTNLIGLEGEGIKEIAETARIEDCNHFESLVLRICELGGVPPEGVKAFLDMAVYAPTFPRKDSKDVQAMLTVLVTAKRCAVSAYTDICNRVAGKDQRTYDLCLAILQEEIEHESWFSEFLGKDHRTYDLCLAILHEEIGMNPVCRNPRTRNPRVVSCVEERLHSSYRSS